MYRNAEEWSPSNHLEEKDDVIEKYEFNILERLEKRIKSMEAWILL